MKIAIIRQKFVLYGGAEQFADGFIHQLAESGHEVHIFSNSWTPSHHSNINHHFVGILGLNAFFRTLSFSIKVSKKIRKSNISTSFKVMKKPGIKIFIERVMGAI